MAVRAVKGTVFSTALRTTRTTTARTRQDKDSIRKADSYRGLALLALSKYPTTASGGAKTRLYRVCDSDF